MVTSFRPSVVIVILVAATMKVHLQLRPLRQLQHPLLELKVLLRRGHLIQIPYKEELVSMQRHQQLLKVIRGYHLL